MNRHRSGRARRRGVLSRRWLQRLAAYGEFMLKRPFSEAMASFAQHDLAADEEKLLKGTRP
jgi:hypothetical protein